MTAHRPRPISLPADLTADRIVTDLRINRRCIPKRPRALSGSAQSAPFRGTGRSGEPAGEAQARAWAVTAVAAARLLRRAPAQHHVTGNVRAVQDDSLPRRDTAYSLPQDHGTGPVITVPERRYGPPVRA